jgi:hypothetical protein
MRVNTGACDKIQPVRKFVEISKANFPGNKQLDEEYESPSPKNSS